MVTGNRADNMMEAIKIIDKDVTKELDGDSIIEGSVVDKKQNKKMLWKTQLLHLSQVYANGGNMHGIPVIRK